MCGLVFRSYSQFGQVFQKWTIGIGEADSWPNQQHQRTEESTLLPFTVIKWIRIWRSLRAWSNLWWAVG